MTIYSLDVFLFLFFFYFNLFLNLKHCISFAKFKTDFLLSSFTLIKRFFSSFSLSAIKMVSSAYLRLLIFLPPILIPAYNSSSPAFLMMCSACKLNKQGNNRQPCCTPFSILIQSVVPHRVLTFAY